MNFENICIWCWLIPLLVGVICGYFGYLIGKGNGASINNASDIKLIQNKNTKLQADLDTCKGKLSGKTDGHLTSYATVSTEASTSFNAASAKAVFGKTVKQDDLKIIEGIGPKIEEMFKKAEIETWKTLSETAVAECQEVLNVGGKRYRIHDPASWPMQAKMAYEGKWPELFKWQEKHKHGKL